MQLYYSKLCVDKNGGNNPFSQVTKPVIYQLGQGNCPLTYLHYFPKPSFPKRIQCEYGHYTNRDVCSFDMKSIGVPYHRRGVELYLVLARSLQELTHHNVRVSTQSIMCPMTVSSPYIIARTKAPRQVHTWLDGFSQSRGLRVILPFFTLPFNPHTLSTCIEYYSLVTRSPQHA